MKLSFLILLLLLIANLHAGNNHDGELDVTFNKTGKLNLAIGTQFNVVYSVLVQQDHKILACGTVDTNFAIIRLNIDGSFDKSFANSGKFILPVINTDSLRQSMALAKNGKIYITGASNDQFIVIALNSNGTFDSNFANNGILAFSFGSGIDSNSIQLDSNNKIVIAGDSFSGGTINVIRLNNDGTFDKTFTDGKSGPGKVAIPFSLSATQRGLAIQKDNKILVSGTISGFFSVLRLQSNGSLDLNFGPLGLGYVTIISGISACANALTLQSDGKIIAGGQSDSKFVVAKLNSDGTLDQTFNKVGYVITALDQKAAINSVVVQNWDNKIVVAGFSVLGATKFIVARYATHGKLDNSFGIKGIIFTNFGQAFLGDNANSITIDQSARKIIAGGNTGNNFAISRYLADAAFTKCITQADIFIINLLKKYH